MVIYFVVGAVSDDAFIYPMGIYNWVIVAGAGPITQGFYKYW